MKNNFNVKITNIKNNLSTTKSMINFNDDEVLKIFIFYNKLDNYKIEVIYKKRI